MELAFDAEVYRWAARTDAAWYFASVPAELGADIAEITAPFTRGFGAVRVRATIGATSWRTSIFPGASGAYALPLKRSVREAEGVAVTGDVCRDRFQA